MSQTILRSPLFLLAFGTSSLFVGAAFVYMATKSPYFWGGMYLPGVILVLLFVATSILAVVSLLRKPKSSP